MRAERVHKVKVEVVKKKASKGAIEFRDVTDAFVTFLIGFVAVVDSYRLLTGRW